MVMREDSWGKIRIAETMLLVCVIGLVLGNVAQWRYYERLLFRHRSTYHSLRLERENALREAMHFKNMLADCRDRLAITVLTPDQIDDPLRPGDTINEFERAMRQFDELESKSTVSNSSVSVVSP
jgi:hypothetical protein